MLHTLPRSTILDTLLINRAHLKRPSQVYLRLYALALQREQLGHRVGVLGEQLASMTKQSARLGEAAMEIADLVPEVNAAREPSIGVPPRRTAGMNNTLCPHRRRAGSGRDQS